MVWLWLNAVAENRSVGQHGALYWPERLVRHLQNNAQGFDAQLVVVMRIIIDEFRSSSGGHQSIVVLSGSKKDGSINYAVSRTVFTNNPTLEILERGVSNWSTMNNLDLNLLW